MEIGLSVLLEVGQLVPQYRPCPARDNVAKKKSGDVILDRFNDV
jgi:hypothetical protein